MIFDWLLNLFKEKKPDSVEGEKVGMVTHYFSKPKVAVIKIEKGKVSVGETLMFRGHTTDFKQKVESLQVDHQPVSEVGRGKEAGVQVRARVRPNDAVYKV